MRRVESIVSSKGNNFEGKKSPANVTNKLCWTKLTTREFQKKTFWCNCDRPMLH